MCPPTSSPSLADTGADGGRVDCASVSPWLSLLGCPAVPGGRGIVCTPPVAPAQPNGCRVCVGPAAFGVYAGRMPLLSLLVMGPAGSCWDPCPIWGADAAPPLSPAPPSPPPAHPRHMCCSCAALRPIWLGPSGDADAPPRFGWVPHWGRGCQGGDPVALGLLVPDPAPGAPGNGIGCILCMVLGLPQVWAQGVPVAPRSPKWVSLGALGPTFTARAPGYG